MSKEVGKMVRSRDVVQAEGEGSPKGDRSPCRRRGVVYGEVPKRS